MCCRLMIQYSRPIIQHALCKAGLLFSIIISVLNGPIIQHGPVLIGPIIQHALGVQLAYYTAFPVLSGPTVLISIPCVKWAYCIN